MNMWHFCPRWILCVVVSVLVLMVAVGLTASPPKGVAGTSPSGKSQTQSVPREASHV